jgi:hypothetical protein
MHIEEIQKIQKAYTQIVFLKKQNIVRILCIL